MNTYVKNTTKICSRCLTVKQMQFKERIIQHQILGKPWKVVSACRFSLYNKHYLRIVDYYSKFPIVKRAEGLLADSIIPASTVNFAVYQLPRRIVSEAGSIFVSKKFKGFCRNLSIETNSMTIITPSRQWKD